MKRLLSILTLVVMSLGFTMTAQANVLENAGNYYGMFGGQEVVFGANGQQITNAEDLLTNSFVENGLDMYALAVINSMNITDKAGSDSNPNYPSIYPNANNQGTYFTTLTGFKSAFAIQTQGGFDIYFTGGTLNWYYSENSALNANLHNAVYDSVTGDYMVGGTPLGDIIGDPFMVADLVAYEHYEGGDYTGKVSVTYEAGGQIRAKFQSYANVLDEYDFWRSGAYGNTDGSENAINADIEFSANLVWREDLDKFILNDGSFRVSAPAPEPGTIALMGLGLLGLAAAARRRRSN